MRRIFLAFSFRPDDQALARATERLIASHGFRVETGVHLGGRRLTPAIKGKIRDCDGLVALLTRRDELQEGGWTSHDWVKDEFKYAKDQGKSAIAVVEQGVQHGGMYQEEERLDLERGSVHEGLLDLSETLAIWRAEKGRVVKIQLLPGTLAERLATRNGAAVCRYRFLIDGQYRSWQGVEPVHEVGGTFLYILGVGDEYMIQLEVEEEGTKWISPASPQWMQIELRKKP